MNRLQQQFEKPVKDAAGVIYNVYLYGRSRPSSTWQGWLEFERTSDGRRFSTGVETTQPNAEALLYWATGLSGAYFEGALQRATNPATADRNLDTEPRVWKLADLERALLDCFRRRRLTRLLTQTIFDDLPFAHADVVRGLEDLEKQGGLLVRRTEDGNDFVYLTHAGVRATGLEGVPVAGEVIADREPPHLR